jgi:two-component system, chemotaxis family, chemotaxis protein CheY
MVVEDDEDVRLSIGDFLASEGIAADLAPSGEQALEALRRGPLPDVMLVDLGIPGGMSGEELLRVIRQEEAWACIPVAVMSGVPRSRFEFLPADVYVEKPFDVERLNGAISTLCARRQQAVAAHS